MSGSALPVVPVSGLRPDSLGNYLASLGLVRILTRHAWPNVSLAWRDGVLQIVGGPRSMDELVDALGEVASRRAWTPYERHWGDSQKQSTRRQSGLPLALWQASAAEQDLEMLSAHVVPGARLSFNPLLGSGGNAGKRDFSDGWKRAVEAIGRPAAAVREISELKSLLQGQPVSNVLEKLNAASWFSDANKLYNSGQRAYREGAVSPWAMVLACEGLANFAGSSSRRLGSRVRAVGAFPFVTKAAAPSTAGEAGHDLAEVWAPVWIRPMTLPEITALFSRGRAEIGGRGALTPNAFAAAIMNRGVDAGIAEFRRFVLARTTSANTFEPRFDGVFRVPSRASQGDGGSVVMERLLSLTDQFAGPLADRKVGKRWRYVGLKGDIEAGMLRLAASPANSEVACSLLDSVVSTLDRIDRNRTFREQSVNWRPLPLSWLPTVLGDEAPRAEARLALALVSSFPADWPFALYRFGVVTRGSHFVHPPQSPQQWVWRAAMPLPRLLSDVLYRRTLDWEAAMKDGTYSARAGSDNPRRPGVPTTRLELSRWLDGHVDDELVARWLSRFALFEWRRVPPAVRYLGSSYSGGGVLTGASCLSGLLHPLFDLRAVFPPNKPTLNLLRPESRARTPAAARTLLGLLRAGDVMGAIRFAVARYSVAGAPLVKHNVTWNCGDVDRLAASLLFSLSDGDRWALVTRWLRPHADKENPPYDA